MHKKTRSFMARLNDRNQDLETEIDDRLKSILKRPQASTKSAKPSPSWIDTSEVEDFGEKRGTVIDFLVGKTKVKSFNQRGEKSP